MQEDSWEDLYDFCELSSGPIRPVSFINQSKSQTRNVRTKNQNELSDNELLEGNDRLKPNNAIDGPDLSFIQNMVQNLDTCYTNDKAEHAYRKSGYSMDVDKNNVDIVLNPSASEFIPKSSTNAEEVSSSCEIIEQQDEVKEHTVDMTKFERSDCKLINKSNLEIKKIVNPALAINSGNKFGNSEFLSKSPKHKKRLRNVAISSLINKQEKNAECTVDALIENVTDNIIENNKNNVIVVSSSNSDISNIECKQSIRSASDKVGDENMDICQDLMYPDANSREKVLEWLKPSNQYAKNLMNPSKCISRQPKVYKPNSASKALYNNLQEKIKKNSVKGEDVSVDNLKNENSKPVKSTTVWDYCKDKINKKS